MRTPDNYDRLHAILREDLQAANQDADPALLDFMEDVALLQEGPASPDTERAPEVHLDSAGNITAGLYRDPYVILRLDFRRLSGLVAGTIKDVGVIAVNGKALNVPKAAYSTYSLINRFYEAATHVFQEADARVLYAVARVDQRQVTRAATRTAFTELFGAAVSDDHLDNAFKKFHDLGFTIPTGNNSIRLKENIVIKRGE